MKLMKVLNTTRLIPALSRRCQTSSTLQDKYSCTVPYFSIRDLVLHSKQFDEIIDVRTSEEFEEDRILSAINLPVLNEQEREEVGTLYHNHQSSGRRVGAALISANCSQHIINHFIDKPLDYKPLVYCWRGGQRSRALAIILKEIGFQPSLLQGGYKEYRRHVRESIHKCSEVQSKLEKLCFMVVSGPTGSAKSLILETLRERGEQVLHLEEIARHKGSVLGNYPGEPQPSQKLFDSRLFEKIEFEFETKKVIWVENESSKVGKIGVPKQLRDKMLKSPRVHLVAQLEERVSFILQDYEYFCSEDNKDILLESLSKLEKHVGKKKCKYWFDLVGEQKFRELVTDLIVEHYDKSYKKPEGEASVTYNLLPNLMLNKTELLESEVIQEMIDFGQVILNSEQLDEHCLSSFS